MGIKGLTKLLATHAPKSLKEEKLETYKGKMIAIDVSRSVYEFLIVVGRNGHGALTNQFGEVTSHLQGMFYRAARLLVAGVMPTCILHGSFVFDGKPPYLKKDLLMTRIPTQGEVLYNTTQAINLGERVDIDKCSKETVKDLEKHLRAGMLEDKATRQSEETWMTPTVPVIQVTKKQNEDCKLLLTLMGIPVLQAPSEAEAECASLCKVGKVDAAASDDTDLLAFGTPRFLRHLTDSPSRKNPVIEFELSKVLDELNLSMDQFVDMCILCGCSYCETIGGIGPQTSLKLIQEHGSIEKILDNIDKDRFQIPVHWPYLQARSIFKEPQITPLEYQSKLEWSAPDEEGLKKFLVDENGFSFERIMKVIKKIKSIKSTSERSLV
ncbi:flap endonuclease 1-B isoform X2 [Cryptomeria japonica]|uniref:flap endonuclease 1-B isoform X2 n=1 Tax=Cryptomeria japonica TaxID=3369 RepID=UPI0025AB920E|nr:flap endonuclease 1-B isoform X2 [Cryptomeria japonica]XP_057815650.1 flap endonuclease 1-B isoform X2 [Cryptomeria japonica]XP_057815651.1 flap endonuclease 1-B isoform X2 [Cryptomeria japonica]XP_057815652.1 flap endonuclease 1-B isoform X2 [Cryptomeria japonica]